MLSQRSLTHCSWKLEVITVESGMSTVLEDRGELQRVNERGQDTVNPIHPSPDNFHHHQAKRRR